MKWTAIEQLNAADNRSMELLSDMFNRTIEASFIYRTFSGRSQRFSSTHYDHCHSTLLVVSCPQHNQDEHHMDKKVGQRQPLNQKDAGACGGWGALDTRMYNDLLTSLM